MCPRTPFVAKLAVVSLKIDQDHGRFRQIVRGRIRQNLRKFSDIEPWAKVLAGELHSHPTEVKAFLADALELLPPEPWDETTWSQWTTALKQKSGRKGRDLFHPLRLALTGREDGPDFKSLLPLLGRKVCRDRLS